MNTISQKSDIKCFSITRQNASLRKQLLVLYFIFEAKTMQLCDLEEEEYGYNNAINFWKFDFSFFVHF